MSDLLQLGSVRASIKKAVDSVLAAEGDDHQLNLQELSQFKVAFEKALKPVEEKLTADQRQRELAVVGGAAAPEDPLWRLPLVVPIQIQSAGSSDRLSSELLKLLNSTAGQELADVLGLSGPEAAFLTKFDGDVEKAEAHKRETKVIKEFAPDALSLRSPAQVLQALPNMVLRAGALRVLAKALLEVRCGQPGVDSATLRHAASEKLIQVKSLLNPQVVASEPSMQLQHLSVVLFHLIEMGVRSEIVENGAKLFADLQNRRQRPDESLADFELAWIALRRRAHQRTAPGPPQPLDFVANVIPLLLPELSPSAVTHEMMLHALRELQIVNRPDLINKGAVKAVLARCTAVPSLRLSIAYIQASWPSFKIVKAIWTVLDEERRTALVIPYSVAAIPALKQGKPSAASAAKPSVPSNKGATSSMSPPQQPSAKKPSGRRPPRCFWCGEEGHKPDSCKEKAEGKPQSERGLAFQQLQVSARQAKLALANFQ
jgi:hypothetical protein